jgi:hypothetical protein
VPKRIRRVFCEINHFKNVKVDIFSIQCYLGDMIELDQLASYSQIAANCASTAIALFGIITSIWRYSKKLK